VSDAPMTRAQIWSLVDQVGDAAAELLAAKQRHDRLLERLHEALDPHFPVERPGRPACACPRRDP
jgi:hypothetical protein